MESGQDGGREGEEVMEQNYERFEFQGLDELLKIRESLPVPGAVNLGKLASGFVNGGDFSVIHSGARVWQVASAGYTLIDHQQVIGELVNKLGELGLDDIRGRVKTWNYGGRIWVECLEPKDYEPLPGDRYNRGFWFKNSYDGSNALGGGFYAYRQVCSNGMHAWVKELLARKIHLGKVKLGDWMRATIEEMRGQQDSFERMIQKAAATRLEVSVQQALESLEVGPLTQKKIIARLEDASRDQTAYDLYNAVTAYASHDLKDKPLAQESYGRVAQRILVAPEIMVKQR